MNLTTRILVLSIGVLLISSCKDEPSETKTLSCTLSKTVYFKSDTVSGYSVYAFNADGNCTVIDHYDAFANKSSERFEYDNNGRINRYTYKWGTVDTFVYVNKRRVKYGITALPDTFLVTQHESSVDTVFHVPKGRKSMGNRFLHTYEGDNLIMTVWEYDTNDDGIVDGSYNPVTYTYDDHPNPYTGVPEIDWRGRRNKNNVLTSRVGNNTNTWVYSYNEQGYPDTMWRNQVLMEVYEYSCQ